MTNRCPRCKVGYIFIRPKKENLWHELCTNCRHSVVRTGRRRRNVSIDFPDRRTLKNRLHIFLASLKKKVRA